MEFFKRFTTTLDIENSKLPNLSVYPNPATDILQVNGFNNTDHGLISILDVSGRVVMQKCFENGFTTLNVSKLQSGAYILQLNDGNSIQTARFLKQ